MVPGTRRFLLRHPKLLAAFVAIYGEKFRRKYDCRVRLGSDGKSFAIRKRNRELWLSIHQSAYVEDAAQRFDYYFDAIVPEVVGNLEIADFRNPRKHTVRGVAETFEFSSFPESSAIADAYLNIFK